MARHRFNFWLDFSKDDELLVAETIDELKVKRSFASVVRDGIMIVNELRQGRVDLLLKLYPFVADAIRPTAPPVDPDRGDLERLIEKAVHNSVSNIIQLPAPPVDYPVMKQAATGTLGGLRKMALPVIDDDDDDTIVINKTAAPNVMQNFLDSFAKL